MAKFFKEIKNELYCLVYLVWSDDNFHEIVFQMLRKYKTSKEKWAIVCLICQRLFRSAHRAVEKAKLGNRATAGLIHYHTRLLATLRIFGGDGVHEKLSPYIALIRKVPGLEEIWVMACNTVGDCNKRAYDEFQESFYSLEEVKYGG